MSLTKYKQKRSAEKTPEPFGGKAAGKELVFVIQKHAASHLHYDFRLEMDGVLKSWAIPKGPSLDPSVKRLAMMVEDHPYDYRTFEGIIPQGQYGGGTVIVWDEGTYEPIETVAGGKDAQEKDLLKQLKSGSLKIVLKGHKLKGEFALVKTKGMGDNAWLLIKHNDKYAKDTDVTLKDKSVVSKKTLEQVEKTSDNIYGETVKPAAKSAAAKKTAVKKAAKTVKEKKSPVRSELSPLLKGSKKKAFFHTVNPMLATLVDQPFDEKGWVYEVKWDGYRAIALMNKNSVELKSRNDKSFNAKFYPVYDSLTRWGINAVVDGEIVVSDEEGNADFGALQNWRSEADGALVYYIFDILWYDGHDLTGLPLITRKKILELLIPEDPLIQVSKDFVTSGIRFLETAKKMGLEGIMAKRADSIYLPGERNHDWLKIKASMRQEVVIGGFTKNKDTKKDFSSLLVGVFRGKNLCIPVRSVRALPQVCRKK